jgi:flagellar basal body-associated protein FliL
MILSDKFIYKMNANKVPNNRDRVLTAKSYSELHNAKKKQVLQKHRRVKEAVRAQAKLQEELDGNPGKFSIRKMATGTIDDFHKGLQDRIGGWKEFTVFILEVYHLVPCLSLVRVVVKV